MRLATIAFACAAILYGEIRAAAQSSTPWHESAFALHRVTLKPTTQFWRFEHQAIDLVRARQQMIQWQQEGISALEIFAPEMGGNSYDGLDAIDRYPIDPTESTTSCPVSGQYPAAHTNRPRRQRLCNLTGFRGRHRTLPCRVQLWQPARHRSHRRGSNTQEHLC